MGKLPRRVETSRIGFESQMSSRIVAQLTTMRVEQLVVGVPLGVEERVLRRQLLGLIRVEARADVFGLMLMMVRS